MGQDEKCRDYSIDRVARLDSSSIDLEGEKTIDSSTFFSKAKAALSYYQHAIFENNSLDAFYHLGDHSNNNMPYAEGKGEQKNNAHFLEMAGDGYLMAGVPNGGTKIYEFKDRGFNLSGARQVVSKKVNFSVKNIGAAQISNLDAGVENSNTQYFLSNDGGLNWQETTPGQIVIFENQNDANDLRWKIVITPDNGIVRTTPYLSSINFKYWYRR